jgi:SHS2 domain-containing protein
MSSHEVIDHTADAGIRVEAASLPELFAEAAVGMFEIICDMEGVGTSYEGNVRVEADSPEDLMHDWLAELLFIHETEDVLLSKFTVEHRGNAVDARVIGQKIDPEKHLLKTEIKAVTYHMLTVREEGERWHANVLFDV